MLETYLWKRFPTGIFKICENFLLTETNGGETRAPSNRIRAPYRKNPQLFHFAG